MKLVRVAELFDVVYGNSLELNALTLDPDGINFVSRTAKNNGVSARIAQVPGVKPVPAGMLTVAAGGSVLATFVQPEPFYSGRDLYYLRPIVSLTLEQKLFCCVGIKANRYRYNYGRQANKTLRDLRIPDPRKAPAWVHTGFADIVGHWRQVLANAATA